MKHSYINPAGFLRKENTSTRLRKGRPTKHASSFDENDKQKVSKWSQFTKEAQNPIVTLKWREVEGRNCSGVDGNMISLSPGPSDSNLYSQPQIMSKETMQPRSEVRPAPSRNLGGTQTTLVVQNNPNKERKQDSETYWAFTPTAAGIKLREDLQKEEEQKEKMKEGRRGKKTKQTTKASEAFLKTTESRVQERTLRSDSNCPFCNRSYLFSCFIPPKPFVWPLLRRSSIITQVMSLNTPKCKKKLFQMYSSKQSSSPRRPLPCR